VLALGLLLLLLGVLAVLAAVFVSEPGSGGQLLGFDVTTLGAFLIGWTSAAAILVGMSLAQRGTRRGLSLRRERKNLSRQNDQLLQQQAAREEKTVPVVDKRTRDDDPA